MIITLEEPTYEREANYVMAWKPENMQVGLDVGAAIEKKA